MEVAEADGDIFRAIPHTIDPQNLDFSSSLLQKYGTSRHN
jgi:hypothetical protein